MANSQLSATDSIYVIQVHTSNRPRAVVDNLLASSLGIPEITLDTIWETLISRFGTSYRLAEDLLAKVSSFPAIKSTQQLHLLEDLLDLCRIINSNIPNCTELQQMNLSCGMKKTWEKLPDNLQQRWRKTWYDFEHATGYEPQFVNFVEFLRRAVDEFSIPLFKSPPTRGGNVKTLQTEVRAESIPCNYHDHAEDELADCKALHKLPYEEIRRLTISAKACFKCLKGYRQADCKSSVQCDKCGGPHLTVLHREKHRRDRYNPEPRWKTSPRSHERKGNPRGVNTLNLYVDKTKKSKNVPQICSKTLLVEVRAKGSIKSKYCFCILDEQSNTSFIDTSLIRFFNLQPPRSDYSITTMQGVSSKVEGCVVSDLEVRGLNQNSWIALPQLFSNDNIPDTRFEVATRSVVSKFPDISHLAKHFMKHVGNHEVLLLIGSNCGPAMVTKTHSNKAPIPHETSLGWSLVGPVSSLNSRDALVMRTKINEIEHFKATIGFPSRNYLNSAERYDDELPGLSKDDEQFINIMKNNVSVTKEGNLQLPLPMKDDLPLPNNKNAVYNRTFNTLARIKRDPNKLNRCLEVMGRYLSDGHVRQIPHDESHVEKGKAWWIPIFAIEHPIKKKVRLVFDSSATFQGRSLNQKLLQGPDNNNLLLGVLLRFRLERVGFSGDIEHMFHCFYVSPEYRNYQRFFWFANNDAADEIVQFQILVQPFGHRSSPAVANFCLNYAAENSPVQCPESSRHFIKHSTYVDDSLGSAPSHDDAIETLEGAINMLKHYGMRMHKLVSNSEELLAHFPHSERAEESKLIMSDESASSTLGLVWNTREDRLSLRNNSLPKPFTKRGILSVNNSCFDPLGVASPVTLGGKLFQRMVLPPKTGEESIWSRYSWDDTLPQEHLSTWEKWQSSLNDISKIQLDRCYKGYQNLPISERLLHVYCDASKDVIAYIIYMQTRFDNDDVHVSFVMANSKVSPRLANTIPRLELNAAVEAVLATQKLLHELQLNFSSIHYYTDSEVLLGYLSNRSKSFARYVTRRIETILSYSSFEQWRFFGTEENPADIGTRIHTPMELLKTRWLTGPLKLWMNNSEDNNPYLEVEELPETVQTKVLHTKSKEREYSSISADLCTRTNDFNKVINVTKMILKLRNLSDIARQKSGTHLAPRESTASHSEAVFFLIKNSQRDIHGAEIDLLSSGRTLPLKHHLSKLSVFIDDQGILRVGGRLRRSELPFHVKHPVLLPKLHPLSSSVLNFYHRKVSHAGRHITHGALREAGFYLHGCSKVLREIISKCVTCRALRAPTRLQMMSDLPVSRLERTPPFSSVGLDAFGPYLIHDGAHSTRRTKATKKIWGILFTCLFSRAIHIEPLYGMDTSSFRNSLRRFWSIRGTSSYMISDRGRNFLGARNQMESFDLSSLKTFADSQNIKWDFITPSASYQGGIWERKIGAFKNALNSSIRQLHGEILSRDEIITLFCKCCSEPNSFVGGEFGRRRSCSSNSFNALNAQRAPSSTSVRRIIKGRLNRLRRAQMAARSVPLRPILVMLETKLRAHSQRSTQMENQEQLRDKRRRCPGKIFIQ